METCVIGVCDDDPEDVERICEELIRCIRHLGERDPILRICQSGEEMLEQCRNQKMRLVLFTGTYSPRESLPRTSLGSRPFA